MKTGRGLSDVWISHQMLAAIRNQERVLGQILSQSPRKEPTQPTPSFQTGPQNREKIISIVLSHQVGDNVLWQPQGTNLSLSYV